MKFKDDGIKLKIFRQSWFWAFQSHFYTGWDRWRIIKMGVFQSPPKFHIEDYYPHDVALLSVVKMVIYWSAMESPVKAKIKFDFEKDRLKITETTKRRIERHFELWGFVCEDK